MKRFTAVTLAGLMLLAVPAAAAQEIVAPGGAPTTSSIGWFAKPTPATRLRGVRHSARSRHAAIRARSRR